MSAAPAKAGSGEERHLPWLEASWLRQPMLCLGISICCFVTSCGPADQGVLDCAMERNTFRCEGNMARSAGEETFEWNVSGKRALIRWTGSEAQRGELQLTVRDGGGAELYSGHLTGPAPSDSVTRTGEPGTWTLRFAYTRLEADVLVSGVAVID